jgi:two-component system phosphate regulon response regulator PhoB
MPAKTILVIEDDPDLVEIIQYNLEREGYRVLAARNGEEGLIAAAVHGPDLIVLDVLLPGLDGIEVCKQLRAKLATRSIPIVILSVKDEERDIVLGLGAGADDYVAKPFSPKAFLGRIAAALRRGHVTGPVPTLPRIERADLVIDPNRFEVTVRAKPIPLTATEFKILSVLAADPGRVHTRQMIIGEIQGGAADIDPRVVDVHVRSIRRKLGDLADAIITVRGVGYRFRD